MVAPFPVYSEFQPTNSESDELDVFKAEEIQARKEGLPYLPVKSGPGQYMTRCSQALSVASVSWWLSLSVDDCQCQLMTVSCHCLWQCGDGKSLCVQYLKHCQELVSEIFCDCVHSITVSFWCQHSIITVNQALSVSINSCLFSLTLSVWI